MTNGQSKLEIVKQGEVWVDPNGSTCGDVSIGFEASVSRTWITGKPAQEGGNVTLEVTYYVEARLVGEDGIVTEGPMDFDDWKALDVADMPKVRYSVEARFDWIVHTEWDDPGSSEVNSHFEYGEGGVHDWEFLTIEEANARAVNAAKTMASFNEIYPENLEVLK